MLAGSGMSKKRFADPADHILRGSKDCAMEISAPMPPQHGSVKRRFQEQKACLASDPDVGKYAQVSMLHGSAMLDGYLCGRITDYRH